jgi:hypothetical protein
MTIEQIVDIPVNRHLSLDLPAEIPAGKAYIALFIHPQTSETIEPVPSGGSFQAKAGPGSSASQGQSKDETFRNGLRRAYGAWQNRPWENALEDIRTMRDEWDRDPWKTGPAMRHS